MLLQHWLCLPSASALGSCWVCAGAPQPATGACGQPLALVRATAMSPGPQRAAQDPDPVLILLPKPSTRATAGCEGEGFCTSPGAKCPV